MRALPTPKRGFAVFAVVLAAAAGSAPAAAATRPAGGTSRAVVPPGITEESRALADAAALSDKGRIVYFSNEPTVDDRSAFVSHCPKPETRASYLLGCYTPALGRIHVLRIDRPELGSGMAVTAAHEMLHAAHHELTSRQLAKLEPLLEWTYGATEDAKLHAEVDAYPRSQRLDEIYARLGTEVAPLPPKLEHHYSAFFADRSVVVAASAAYRRVFDDLDAELAQLDAQLASIEQEGDAVHAQLDAAGAEADRLGAEIDSLRAQGRFGESNQLVDPANAAAGRANALADVYNELVDRHNELVDTYNTLALTNQQLVDSLTPRPTTWWLS